MTRLLCALVLALALTGAANAASLADVKAKGQLRVAVYKDFPPFSHQDQGDRGIDVDLARALADKLGVKLSLMWLQADENVDDDLRNAVWKGHYLGGGVADVMLHVPVDPRLAEGNPKTKIFGPYYRERFEIGRSLARIPDLLDLEPFRREKVGVEIESAGDTFMLSAQGGLYRENVVHFKTAYLAIDALVKGDLTAVVAQRSELLARLGSNPAYRVGPLPAARGGMPMSTWTPGMAVKAEDGADLAEALQKALAELESEGAVAAIFRRHGVERLGLGQ